MTIPGSSGAPHSDAQPVQSPGYSCQVFPAQRMVVRAGANLGDPVGGMDEICLGDVYHLIPGPEARRLKIRPSPPGHPPAQGNQCVAPHSEVGRPGAPVQLAARLTLMAPDGDMVECLVLRLDDPEGQTFVLPLSPLAPKTDYTVIRATDEPGEVQLSELVCTSFARGTSIALADGRQVPIETLSPGDRVLTRDHGAQPVRWIGQATLRARGANAPVVVTAGTLGNSGDLVVGQHHRMFLYQRGTARVTETAELLVQAKHLVDGERVLLRPGGYVDYFSLVFDQHEIIYAEGIPAESLMVNEATLAHLPSELAEEVQARFPRLSHRQHFGTEASRHALGGRRAADLLRQELLR